MVGKYYRQIKTMKEKGVDLRDSETARVRKVSENILKIWETILRVDNFSKKHINKKWFGARKELFLGGCLV